MQEKHKLFKQYTKEDSELIPLAGINDNCKELQ